MMIYSIIPARGGSKGIPKKNIKLLNGKPLIAYSIRASKQSQLIKRTIVSTDSEEIAGIAKSFGAEVPFLRPSHLAGDKSTDYEFVAHALNWFKQNEGEIPDYLVHLRPTTPLREIDVVDEAIRKIISKPHSTALRSVQEMSESAYKCFETHDGFLKTICTGFFELDAANNARQKFPRTYQANGYVDVLKSAFLIQNKKIHGDKVIAYITPKVVEVDAIEDFEILEYQINKNKKIFENIFG